MSSNWWRIRYLSTFSVIGLVAGFGFMVLDVPAQQVGRGAQPDRVDYNWEIRPILSENCFRCHGPDAKSRQAGLRLDLPDAAYAQAIAPGKPEESELVNRITSKDPSYRMPPPAASAKPLTDTEIGTLREWIRQGAEYKPHWAFIPPVKVSPPETKFADRVANAVDRFIFARLDKEGLHPSPEAEKAALINRVTFSLTGLPPTLDDIDAFLADKSRNAYEKVIDRLLASPAYGEHMAAYWMNIARYSDSDGFLDDHSDRMFWPYRDWVIAEFNKNMAFDQFGAWQIAGDLLPNATKEQRLATAFLRVGKRTTENGAIDEEYRAEYALDRANTVGEGFLALTTGCARCHDHKYDPITQKEYYSLSGFFNSTDEPGFFAPGYTTVTGGPTLQWTTPQTDTKLAAAAKKIQEAEAAHAAARKAAERDIAGQVSTLLDQPRAILDRVRKSVENSTAAYYPFEAEAPVPDDQLPVSRQATDPPPGLVTLTKAKATQAALEAFGLTPGTPPPAPPVAPPPEKKDTPQANAFAFRRLPNSMIREKLRMSPDGLTGAAPAMIEEGGIRPGGAKGNALFFTDTNRGFLGKDVGYYERTQPFSFDFWLYAAETYENSMVIDHRDDDNSGGSGYKLNLEKNHLSFYMMHSWPYNMLHVVSRLQVPVKEWTHVTVTYDGSSRAPGIHLYINGRSAEVDVEHDQLTESILPRMIGAAFNQFVGVEFGRRFREVTLRGGGLDEMRFFSRTLTPIEVRYLHEGDKIASLDRGTLEREVSELIVAQQPAVVSAAKLLHEAREAQNQIVSWQPEIMVMADAPRPRQTYVLNRGLYNQRLDPVDPAPLTQIFPFDPQLPKNRAGLAKWLFDPKNPLTARVFVNRVWQQMFGRGIVETSEDFGIQGSRPTHPGLLDWLAVDFIQSGWDVKRLNKMIAMSATFRQSSDLTQDLLKKDPANLWYARGPRYRMSAEEIRDNALAVSGLLVKTIGGPSAYPYQPDGIWVAGVTMYRYPKPSDIPPENQHRRSLYSFVKRNTPPASMSIFDFSERHATISRRLTSNTPLQALDLLDDPQYLEAYRVMATNVLKRVSDKDEQIKLVFRRATRRMPREAELAELRKYYDGQLALFANDPKKADAVIHVGVEPVDASVNVGNMAALMNLTEVVMNTPDAYSVY